MSYPEDDLLPLSALQHLLFCERQCALIHIEQVWDDNVRTVEGHNLHERVDAGGTEGRSAIRTAYGVRLRSLQLGLAGRADVVEFHRCDAAAGGIRLPGTIGAWQPFPVEFKRGRPKVNRCDEVQLCAQALCLEEMLGARIPAGALFYGATRRRVDVTLDAELRDLTATAAGRLHELFDAGRTPAPAYSAKCERCSLLHLCLPKLTGGAKSAAGFVARMIREAGMP